MLVGCDLDDGAPHEGAAPSAGDIGGEDDAGMQRRHEGRLAGQDGHVALDAGQHHRPDLAHEDDAV